MRKCVVLAVVVMFLIGLLAASAVAGKMMMMDGTKWKIQMKEMGKPNAKAQPDTLVFQKGMVDSMACHPMGIKQGKYMHSMKGKQMMWSANIKGTKGWDAMWKGQTMGDKISGKVTFTKKGEKPMMYTFTGTKMKPGMMMPKPMKKEPGY